MEHRQRGRASSGGPGSCGGMTKTVGCRVSDTDKTTIEDIARAENVSVSVIVGRAIYEYLARRTHAQ